MSVFGVRPLHPTVPAVFVLVVTCLISGSILLAPVEATAAGGQVIHEGEFYPGDLRWEANPQGAAYPVLDQTRPLSEPGLPMLPVRELILLVPLDAQVENLWIEPLETHREHPKNSLALAAPHTTDSGDMITIRSMNRQGAEFPATWGDFTGSHVWRGYRLATVSVYPVREIQTDQGMELEFLDRFAVRFESGDQIDSGTIAVRQRLIPGEAEENAEILAELVANPEVISSYSREHGMEIQEKSAAYEPDANPSLKGSGVTFLIITNEDMESEFQILADHKTAQGLPTVVATREYIAANFRNGADIQETIRMYILDAYQKWGVEYVLLGGDSDILPPRYIDNSFYPTNGYTSIPVDLYFACLDGNWNANGNADFGEPAASPEPGDLVDFAEEVYIGRATVSSKTAAAVFVNKVISYESADVTADWANRALFAAEVLFPSDYPEGDYIILDGAQYADQQVNEQLAPCTDMEYMRMYQTDTLFPWDAQLSRAALIDTLNSGRYGIFNQIGHGYYFNMSVGDQNFMTTDADNLTNGDHLFMIYALNCASGAFDNSCLLERFVQNPNGGSICSVGSARAAFPNNSNNYQQEFFTLLYCTGEMRVGKLVALSRLPFIGLTTANYVDRWTFENYTLLGDPTLPIWTGSPAVAGLTGPSAFDLGPQTLSYTVTEGGSPVEDALVCIAKEGESHIYGMTDALGKVDLDFLPISPGTATLTVTGKNLMMNIQQLPVTAGDAYVSLSSMPLVDDGTLGSFGNGNGIVESGETIALIPIMLETGGSGTPHLTGILSTADTTVTILTDTADFPSVSAGGTTTAETPFLVHFDPDIRDAAKITFQLDLSAGSDDFASQWSVVVEAPELEVVSMDWEDETFGNGNGILENGERIRITARLKNFGAGMADDVTGYLRSDEPNVTLHDTVATWSDIQLMDEISGSVTYSISLANVMGFGDCFLDVEDNYGRIYHHKFSPWRPLAPVEIMTDTSLGADVIALRWDPSTSADRYGYNVYRSLSPAGPFSRVNQDVIAGTSYYRDDDLQQLTRYFYKVATVDSSRVPSELSDVVVRSTAPAELVGFPVPFANETSSHLAVGDVDGDGRYEIVLASSQVYVFHDNGMELLDGDGDSQTLGVFSNFPAGYVLQPAGIAMANLDRNSGDEMIISERAPGMRIHIFTKDGTELPGWPQRLTSSLGSQWNWAAPAIGDIDGDGEEEIVVNALNGVVFAWHIDGSEVRDGDSDPGTTGPFYVRAGAQWEWSRSGPALCDLDGDGAKDIIFGTRNDDSGLRRLMALKYDGTDVSGFPYTANSPICVDPCVGDLDNDGQVEIVFFDQARYLYVVQQDGTPYPGFPVYMGYAAVSDWVSSPGLGDMDGDGMLEIIYTPNQTGLLSRIIVVDTDYAGGTSGQVLSGWPVVLPGSSEGSPVIGDIDGDLSPDILHGIGGGDESAPYSLYGYHSDGTMVDGFPITLTGPLMPSAVITDIDFDSDVDIVYGGWDFKIHVWDMPFAYDRQSNTWPTFGGNMKRDGVVFPLAMSPVEDPTDIPAANFTVNSVYPNPFNPSTSVRLYIPQSSDLELAVYDVQGRKVRNLHTGGISAGWHTLVWDGRDDAGHGQASGMYFLRAMNAGDVSVQKMTLVK
ncbi:MAG: T9SS type A sorting domain-containing protein [Candidatus Krumholzibacteria bacterium]|nr:T9SS type A sorting domain-containing protein [Candidatus Krumholzibacteria bacterium]